MIQIAHRGNIHGRNELRENHPSYVLNAIDLGYDVEIDVWLIGYGLYLGHDAPQYGIEYSFLTDNAIHLWIHCKNIEALAFLSDNIFFNMFYHKDDIVITTKGYLWTAPGFPITDRSIAVMPELSDGWDIHDALGVCTDFPVRYK